MVEPLSPMALPRRVSGGVFGFTAVSPTGYGAFKLPIDWGQSIYTAQRDSVTGYQGRAIVPNGSTATRKRRRLRFYGCFSHRPRCLQAPIDWGQSIYTKAIIFYVPKSGHKPHLLLHSIRRRKATVGRI